MTFGATLLRAVLHVDGDALVLRVDQPPYIETARGRIEIGTRPLPSAVIAAALEEFLGPESVRLWRLVGSADCVLPNTPDFLGERFAVEAADAARVSLVIRRIRPEAPAPPVVAARAVARFPPLLLLIDDSPDQLDLYALTLSDRYTILTAETGEAGIAVARSEQPDAILLDLAMPHMDGWDVCRYLKSDSRTVAIPIVILTANDVADIHDQAALVGVADVLRKPCNLDLLRDRLRRAIQRQSL